LLLLWLLIDACVRGGCKRECCCLLLAAAAPKEAQHALLSRWRELSRYQLQFLLGCCM